MLLSAHFYLLLHGSQAEQGAGHSILPCGWKQTAPTPSSACWRKSWKKRSLSLKVAPDPSRNSLRGVFLLPLLYFSFPSPRRAPLAGVVAM